MLRETDVVAWFPAWSCTVPVITCPAPPVETVCDGVHEVIGEALLLQVNVTVTFVLFQPAELADGDTDAEILGSACSRFTLAAPVAVFPAMSVATPETG
jgi:hypothetical protein